MIRSTLSPGFVLGVGLALASATGCARRSPPHATAVDAERGNVELAELAQGRKLLLGNCAGCHKVPLPGDQTPAKWPAVLDDMAKRANLDANEEHLIVQYLITMATAEPAR